MARQARVDVPDIPYHVINRAVGRLRIFRSDKDYQLFLQLLKEAKEKTEMNILAFVVMPNHWHLVLLPENTDDLKKFMHLLTNAHTRKVHTITKTIGTGPLYQGRYKSFLVNDDTHLLTVIKYVERNPVRAGLSQRVGEWRWWSGWVREYGSTEHKKLLSDGPTPLPRNYRSWVNTEDKDDVIIRLRTSVNKGTPFGGDDWVNAMIDTYKLKATTRGTGRPKGSKNK